MQRINRLGQPRAEGLPGRVVRQQHPPAGAIHVDQAASVGMPLAIGARLTEAIYPLHIASVGGEWFRWLTFLGGLVPAFLLVTGFLFWRRRRGKP